MKLSRITIFQSKGKWSLKVIMVFECKEKKKRLEAKDEGEIIIGKGETSVIENGSHFQREIRFTGN